MDTPQYTTRLGVPVWGISSHQVLVGNKRVGEVRKDGTKNISNPTETSRGWAFYTKSGIRSQDFYKTKKQAIEALLLD